METSKTTNFYIVRAMGKDRAYEIRHTDNPDLVWTRVDSVEDGHERIKELQLEWKIDQAVTDFLVNLSKELQIDTVILKNLVKGYL